MSGTTGTGLPGSPATLFDHALRLHRLAPDAPLPLDGEPYPDDGSHRDREGPPRPRDPYSRGKAAAYILDEHFARVSADPAELAGAFHDVHIPIHPDGHIAAAAARADPERVRRTGRRLVRYGTDRCAVTVGLALIAEAGTADDIPLIRTIGLLSDHFGPLAAHALERHGGAAALQWLAERVTGWGRVYVVEALCRLDDPAARPWLLRRACDGDFLNGYFAGEVAMAARLHEAVADFGTDDEIVAHTGRLLGVMSQCEGMGLTLADYPYAGPVLNAHARHAGSLRPDVERCCTMASIVRYLTAEPLEAAECTPAEQEGLRATYLDILDREEWVRVARDAFAEGDERMRWLADQRAPWPRLRAFAAGEPDTPAAGSARDRNP